MSTSGIIARPRGDGFAGRYHHTDSYPTGLGEELFRVWRAEFEGNTEHLLRFAVDEHPSGWSNFFTEEARRCYCHSFPERSDYVRLGVQDYDEFAECEWAYVLDGSRMAIFEGPLLRDRGPSTPCWIPRTIVDLEGPEPDWSRIECGQMFERCRHIAGYHEGAA